MARASTVFALMLTAQAAGAQGLPDGHGHSPGIAASPVDVWTEFETSCAAIVADPGGFVGAHPTVGANGEPLVHASEDGQVLVLDFSTDAGVFRQMEVIGVPGQLHIICQANGGEEALWSFEPAQYGALTEQTYREFTSLMSDRGYTVVGGRMPIEMPAVENIPGVSPPSDLYAYILGLQLPMAGKPWFAYANIGGSSIHLTGHYVILADQASGMSEQHATAVTQPFDVNEPAKISGPSDKMRTVIEVCLRNYRTPDAALPALEAAGMTLSVIEDKTFELSGSGVWGIVEPGDELYCTVQSSEVSLDEARALGTELAYSLFPDMVQPGAPEGGNGPCDGLSIFAPRQMIWLRYAQAGDSGECVEDGTSAIIVN